MTKCTWWPLRSGVNVTEKWSGGYCAKTLIDRAKISKVCCRTSEIKIFGAMTKCTWWPLRSGVKVIEKWSSGYCDETVIARNTRSAVPNTLIKEQFRNSNRVEIVHQLPLHLGVRRGVPYTQTSRSPWHLVLEFKSAKARTSLRRSWHI